MDRRRSRDDSERLRIRRQDLEQQRRGLQPPTVYPTASTSGGSEANSPRPSMQMSSEISTFLSPRNSYLHRHRLRRQREEDPRGSVQDTLDQLEVHTSTLQSAIEAPLPLLSPSHAYSPVRAEVMDTYQPRYKRRKLDGDPLDFRCPVRYGFHGQVAPGRLKMQLVNCDGGHLSESEDLLAQRHYSPENVLQNDKSVYCSKKDKCNYLIRHTGETCFSMTKLIIKAPDAGFTAPVQEGMVFVSMSAQELTSRTAHYQIRDSCPSTTGSSSESRLSQLLFPSMASRRTARAAPPVLSQHQAEEPRSPSRRTVNTRLQQQLARLEPLLGESERRTLQRYASRRFGGDPPDDPDPSDLTIATPQPREPSPLPAPAAITQGPYSVPVPPSPRRAVSPAAGFRVTVSCDSPSDDEEDPSSPEILLDRQRRRNGIETSSSDDEDKEEDGGLASQQRRGRRRGTLRKVEWVEDGRPEATGSKAAAPLQPLARFFISRKKHVVTLHFEPAVSAKFILLKLWSPQGCHNIDIQNVSVFGFAGPRYFPAVKPV